MNFRWAWQAQLLSHTLLILHKSVFFEDNQMVFLQPFNISSQFWATKNCWESAIHVFSNPCVDSSEGVSGFHLWFWKTIEKTYEGKISKNNFFQLTVSGHHGQTVAKAVAEDFKQDSLKFKLKMEVFCVQANWIKAVI